METIDDKLPQFKQIRLYDVNQHLDFDSNRYIRLLCRRGYLLATPNPKQKAMRYTRSKTWPPLPEFFAKGVIGLAYYLQTWFRYYLQTWIDSRMGETECKEGVYSFFARPG